MDSKKQVSLKKIHVCSYNKELGHIVEKQKVKVTVRTGTSFSSSYPLWDKDSHKGYIEMCMVHQPVT